MGRGKHSSEAEGCRAWIVRAGPSLPVLQGLLQEGPSKHQGSRECGIVLMGMHVMACPCSWCGVLVHGGVPLYVMVCPCTDGVPWFVGDCQL